MQGDSWVQDGDLFRVHVVLPIRTLTDTYDISGRGSVVDGSAGCFVQSSPLAPFVITPYILIHSAFRRKRDVEQDTHLYRGHVLGVPRFAHVMAAFSRRNSSKNLSLPS